EVGGGGTLVDGGAGPSARGAGRRDDPPRSAAARTGLRAHELAEHAPRHLLQPSGPAARRARDRRGARLGAASVTTRARDADLERDVAFHALRRVHELDLDLGGEVRPTPSARSAETEEVVAEEGGENVGQASE